MLLSQQFSLGYMGLDTFPPLFTLAISYTKDVTRRGFYTLHEHTLPPLFTLAISYTKDVTRRGFYTLTPSHEQLLCTGCGHTHGILAPQEGQKLFLDSPILILQKPHELRLLLMFFRISGSTSLQLPPERKELSNCRKVNAKG